MEADWEVEVGPDAPVIDGAWVGYLDLRGAPERVGEIAEAAEFPALADALRLLNVPGSLVRTAKCDVWQPEVFDADELDAAPEEGRCALACYIDLLPVREDAWGTLDEIADWARRLRQALREVALRRCRADLVIRRGFRSQQEQCLAITAYLTGCGADLDQARESLAAALQAFAKQATVAGAEWEQRYNGRTGASSSIG